MDKQPGGADKRPHRGQDQEEQDQGRPHRHRHLRPLPSRRHLNHLMGTSCQIVSC